VRALRVVFYSAAALIGVFLLVGVFLPTAVHVERSIVTSASPATVYGIVSSFRRFNEWSPWFELDPQAKYTFEGPDSGVGAKLSWVGDPSKVGTGSQEITAVDPGRSVTTRLDFGAQGQANATLTVEPDGSGSRITWAFDSSFEDNFLGRYFGLFFDRWIGADYERGLAKLKTVAESTPPGN
jgi:hypothetical protein